MSWPDRILSDPQVLHGRPCICRLLWLVPLVLALPGLGAADDTSPAPPERFTEHRDTRHGRVFFLRNEAAQPTAAQLKARGKSTRPATLPMLNAAELVAPEWTNAVAIARQFLGRHGGAFARRNQLPHRGAPTSSFDPARDLAALGAQRDELGMTHVRFQQIHRGLPVFGTELIVHLTTDHQVSSAGGPLVPDILVPIEPLITREAAVHLARLFWQAEFHQPADPYVRGARLCIIAPGLLGNDGDPTPYLVWEIKLMNGCTECAALRFPEDYYLDAQTGELRFQHTGVQRLDRRVQDCTTYVARGLCSSGWTDPSTGYHHGRREGESSWGPNPKYQLNDVDVLYDHFGSLHQYLGLKFGRDGANGRGGLGVGTDTDPWTRTRGAVYLDDYPPWQPTCPTAGFDFTQGSVGFCLGTLVTDVVGHEYMHGLPFYSHFDGSGNAVGMVYSGQSGALNESQSDVWGELYQLHLGEAADWVHWPGHNGIDGDRNSASPSSSVYNIAAPTPYPERFHNGTFYCGGSDLGGVHVNSTVPSKAAYLMAVGGAFNGCAVHPIGSAKLEQILYRAVTQYYTSAATFNEAYADLIQAATDLYGAGSEEVRQTTRALQAVELDQPGYCSGLPPRPPQALDVEGW